MPIVIPKMELKERGNKTINVSPQRIDVPGDPTGQGLMQLGQDMQHTGLVGLQIAAQNQHRLDRNKAGDAYNNYSDQVLELEKGYRSLKQKDAEGVFDKSTKEVDGIIRDTLGQLDNDRQREMFKSLARQRRRTFLGSMQRHEISEMKSWEKSSFKSLADNSLQVGIANYNDPEAVRDAEVNIGFSVEQLMPGASAEAKEFVKSSYLTNLHKGIIGRYLIKNPIKAKEHYEKHGDKILGSEKTEIESKLKNGLTKQSAQIQTDLIIATSGPFQEQLNKAREIKDPDVRDSVVARLKAREQEARYIEKRQKQKLIDDTTDKIIQATNLEAALDFADNPIIDGTDKVALRNVAYSEFNRRIKEPKTDPGKMLEARERIDNGEITSSMQLLREYKPYASGTAWNALNGYYQQGGLMGELKDSTARTMFKSMTGKDASKIPELYGQVWDYIVRNVKTTQKLPTDAELRKWMSQALMEGEEVAGGFFDEDMTYVEAVQKGVADQWLPDVSSDEKKRITGVLRAKGAPINSRNIRLYKKHVIMDIPLKRPKEEPPQLRRMH